MRAERIRRATGLSPWSVVGLAGLGAPRAVAHDLGPVDATVNAVLVFAPLALWLVVVLWRRVPNPLVTLITVGLAYGLVLGVVHQMLWTYAYDGDPPSLGGNLADRLPPIVEAAVIRGSALVSSVVTGALVGAAVGAVGWLLARVVPAPHSDRPV